jgi:plastocyanin
MKLLFLIPVLLLAVSSAYADKQILFDHATYNQTITIYQGETINFQNADTLAHTITSGNPKSGPDGIFDSSLMPFGKQFSHTFTEAGLIEAYCVVHPEEKMLIQVLLDQPPVPQSVPVEPVPSDTISSDTITSEKHQNQTQIILGLKAEISRLKAENEQLQAKILELKTIIKEQIKVIMDTLAKIQ